MRLLFDRNLSHRLPDRLADLYPGSAQVRLLGMDRAPDMAIWEYARREGFAIATRDVDLAEIATLRGAPPLVVWLRGGNSSTTVVEAALRTAQENIVYPEENGTAVIEVRW